MLNTTKHPSDLGVGGATINPSGISEQVIWQNAPPKMGDTYMGEKL